MSQINHLLQASQTLNMVFVGGRTPLHWQRTLLPKVAQVEQIRRASDWLAASLPVQPMLRSGSIFGQRLAAVTGTVANIAETPNVEQPTRHPRFAGSTPTPTPANPAFPGSHRLGEQERSATGSQRITPLTGQARPAPLAFGQKVDELFLRRTAGEMPVMGIPSQPQQRLPPERANKTQQVTPWSNDDPSEVERWASELAHRASLRLTRSPLARFDLAITDQAAAVDRAWRQPLLASATAFATTWAELMPADKREATEARSARIAQLDEKPLHNPLRSMGAMWGPTSANSLGQADSEPRTATFDAAAERNQPWQMGPQLATSELLARLIGQAKVAQSAVAVQRQLPNAPTPKPAQGWMTPEAAELSTAEAPTREATTAIAPPTLATQLPPLLPPRQIHQPSLPVASITAQQGGQQSSLQATTRADGEALEELATKIKQILDEEARRHGIDI